MYLMPSLWHTRVCLLKLRYNYTNDMESKIYKMKLITSMRVVIEGYKTGIEKDQIKDIYQLG